MVFTSAEGTINVPVQDFVSFCFDKQVDIDEEESILIDANEPSRQLNTKQCRTLIRRLIAGWKACGLQDGETILCHIGNTYFYPAVFMSIVGAGGVWNGSNPANQVFEVEHFIDLGNPRFIITDPHGLPTVLEVCQKKQFPSSNVFVLDIDTFPLYIGIPSVFWGCSDATKPATTTKAFTDLLCHGEQDWRTLSTVEETKNAPAAYFSTSGTTGLPKLAMVTHHNLIAHHLMVHQDTPYQVRRLISLPLFHLFATSFTFVQPLRYGHITYVMKRWNLEKYLLNHAKHQVTEAYMVPPMLVAMIQSKFDVKELMKTVRYAGVGGAPCDAVSINKMRALLHSDATMTAIWGMTELGVSSLFRLGENEETGSVGRLVRGMEGKLIDEHGNEAVKDGEPGELYCRTEGIMLGYRNMVMDEAEKRWFRTGDICCVREGKLYIVGRAKELIKVKGWQVAPAELEAVLLQHPEICDAAVVGTVAADGVSEVPRAYVIRKKKLHETDMITAEEVYEFARTRLASYKALDGGTCFVEEIPRTASGKIQRAKLSRMNDYRRSIAAVLLANTPKTENQDKITAIKDTAMQDAAAAPARPDDAPRPRRSTRISLYRAKTSTSSIGSSEGLSILGRLGMRARKRTTSTASSDNGNLTTPASPSKYSKVKKKTSRRMKLKKLVQTIQARAA